MHRCLVQPEAWSSDPMPVSASETHRLRHVLRVRAGEEVSVFDGKGNDAIARVEIDETGALCLRRVEGTARALSAVDLTLIQAVPKGHRMDLLVEKCTELGVCKIAPILTRRGVVRPDGVAGERRVARWQRIAEAAARQCGVSVVPRITPLRRLPEALAGEIDPRDVFLVGSLQHAARPLAEVLREVRPRPPKQITILIGPEGDLTEEELECAAAHGAVPVTFGPLVLRVETAAIFSAAAIAYEFNAT